MKYLIVLLMLSSCVSVVVDDQKVPTSPVVKPVETGSIKGEWGNSAWDRALVDQIKASKLDTIVTKDAKEFGYKTGINLTAFYAKILVKMAYYESKYSPSTVYRESFGVNSTGLYQISIQSANYSKRGNCGFKNEAELKDPIKNIKCAVKIFTALIKERGDNSIAGKSLSKGWLGASRYWSVLRGTREYTAKALEAIKNANK
jgi:hypothetical protein